MLSLHHQILHTTRVAQEAVCIIKRCLSDKTSPRRLSNVHAHTHMLNLNFVYLIAKNRVRDDDDDDSFGQATA